ncbi:MAG: 2'-5' RNA ligase family protein [Candidatus Aenigmarchaeota archaeon]|nr:2'-5' RNA ligase family protein [Candidatus Aenigmarchaeota archaeon]
MKIVTGYSIWIKPQGNIKRKLSKLMIKLSNKFDTPKFSTPHITLYENLQGDKNKLILETKELAKSIKPFKLKLTQIDDGKNFKNLVILVKKTRELRNAYFKAKDIFGVKPKKKEYIPHLTLLLKDISQSERKKIIEDIGKNFNLEFEVRSIYLVPIGKNPLKWIPIKRFNLRK